jgi:RND family efflux transporter MFP subunit
LSAAPDLSKLRIARDDQPLGVRTRRWRIPPWLIVGAALAAVAAWFIAQRVSIVEVQAAIVTTAFPSQALTLLNATGYVVAQRKAAVASKATGRLEQLNVTEGSRVKKDEIIARLEAQDVQANVDQAAAGIRAARANLEQGRAELREAKVNYTRSRELARKGFISQSALDTAVARYDKAKAAIRSLEAAIGVAEAAHRAAEVAVEQTLIRAPFEGVVLNKSANVGDIVTPFSSAVDSKGAVVTMADMSTLEVEADVAESNLSKIRVGQPCQIQLDAFTNERFDCTVGRIVPTVDRTKATILVKVQFTQLDPRVLPDMSAKVAFLERALQEVDRKPILAVNPAAITMREGRSVAFVINTDKARAVQVTKGRTLGDLVEVSGIKAGDKVVLNPTDKVRDGTQLKLAQK